MSISNHSVLRALALSSRTSFHPRSVDAEHDLNSFDIEESLQYTIDTNIFLDNSSRQRIDVIRLLSIERECSVFRDKSNNHIIIVDIGFIHVCLILYRFALCFYSYDTNVYPTLVAQVRAAATRFSNTRRAERAHLLGRDDLALGIIQALLTQLPINSSDTQIHTRPFSGGDIEIATWVTHHVSLHEMNHAVSRLSNSLRNQKSRIVTQFCDTLKSNREHNLRSFRTAIASELAAVNCPLEKNSLEEVVDRILSLDAEFCRNIEQNEVLMDEAFADGQAIRDHFEEISKKYPNGSFKDWEQAVAVLHRPWLIQMIIFYAVASDSLADPDIVAGDPIDYYVKISSESSRLQAARLLWAHRLCRGYIKYYIEEWGLPSDILDAVLRKNKRWHSVLRCAVYSAIDPDALAMRDRLLGYERDGRLARGRLGLSKDAARAFNHHQFTPEGLLSNYRSPIMIHW